MQETGYHAVFRAAKSGFESPPNSTPADCLGNFGEETKATWTHCPYL